MFWPRIARSLMVFTLVGCGYTEQEWQALLDKNKRLDQREHIASAKNDELDAALKAERARTTELEAKLTALGFDVSPKKKGAPLDSNMTASDRERAFREYRERSKQLDSMKARYELLRSKLADLTPLGVEIRVRRNRMLISVPGDALFDAGKDKLKKSGREVLSKLATAIKSDAGLAARDYQVVGHTDAGTPSGNLGDNWGLSLMRARQVLLFLTSVDSGNPLPKEHWSAAGYADTDPVASNDTEEGRRANRRCDLVIVPNADENLDLRTLVGPARAALPASPTAVPATPSKASEPTPNLGTTPNKPKSDPTPPNKPNAAPPNKPNTPNKP